MIGYEISCVTVVDDLFGPVLLVDKCVRIQLHIVHHLHLFLVVLIDCMIVTLVVYFIGVSFLFLITNGVLSGELIHGDIVLG